MSVVHVNVEEFDNEILKADIPVLVDFWADWCGPCKMLGPVIEKLAESRDDIKVCKVNIDENEDLALKYQIRSIPCLVLFNDGQEVSRSVGYKSLQELNDWLAR